MGSWWSPNHAANHRLGRWVLVGFLGMGMVGALAAWLAFRDIVSSMPLAYVGVWASWLLSGIVVGVTGLLVGAFQHIVQTPHSRSLMIGSLLVLAMVGAFAPGILQSLRPLDMTLNGVGVLLMALGGVLGVILQVGTLWLAQTGVRLVGHGLSAFRRSPSADGGMV